MTTRQRIADSRHSTVMCIKLCYAQIIMNKVCFAWKFTGGLTMHISVSAQITHLWNIPSFCKLRIYWIFHWGLIHSCVMEPGAPHSEFVLVNSVDLQPSGLPCSLPCVVRVYRCHGISDAEVPVKCTQTRTQSLY